MSNQPLADDLQLKELDLQGFTLAERLNGIALMQDPSRADIVRYAAKLIGFLEGDKTRLLQILREVQDNVRSVDLMSARDAEGNYTNLEARIKAELSEPV